MRVLNDWLLTAERVAVHLPTATAVVADLHLGYAEARQRSGEAVPFDVLDEELSSLDRVLRQHGAQRLVVAGDLLEDGRCHCAWVAFQDWLNQSQVEFVAVVPGNHDHGLEAWSPAPPMSLYPDGFTLGGWRVIHGDGLLPAGRVVHGHEHPWLRWAPRTRAVRPRFFGRRTAPGAIEGPCYLVGPERLILPAYSREASGVNVLTDRRWRPYRCYLVVEDRVLDLGELARLTNRE